MSGWGGQGVQRRGQHTSSMYSTNAACMCRLSSLLSPRQHEIAHASGKCAFESNDALKGGSQSAGDQGRESWGAGMVLQGQNADECKARDVGGEAQSDGVG